MEVLVSVNRITITYFLRVVQLFIFEDKDDVNKRIMQSRDKTTRRNLKTRQPEEILQTIYTPQKKKYLFSFADKKKLLIDPVTLQGPLDTHLP